MLFFLTSLKFYQEKKVEPSHEVIITPPKINMEPGNDGFQ